MLGTPLATKNYPVKLGSQHLLTTHREFGCVPCALSSRPNFPNVGERFSIVLNGFQDVQK